MRASRTRSEEIHDRLGHPVIDTDGHSIDFMPLLEDYVREYTGAKGVDWYRRSHPWYDSDEATRRRERIMRPTWWGYPSRTLDHCTNILPALLEERLGEMGIDFAVIFPSPTRTAVPHLRNDDLRPGMCRALNHYQADLFRPHAARLTPAAVIPMHTPEEALAELDFAVGTLGMKVLQMASYVQRPRDAGIARGTTSAGTQYGSNTETAWWDHIAIDSIHDYDPVWQRCLDLEVAAGFHSGTTGMGSRTSVSNSIYNVLGSFAAAQEAICKALVLGGVAHRFPTLRFAFHESGVAWAASLFIDLVSRSSHRDAASMKANYDPARLDFDEARALFERYGSPELRAKIDEIEQISARFCWPGEERITDLDEFAASGITGPKDVLAQFVPNFFFGTEGDDRLLSVAFEGRALPLGARLKAVFGSDIGHLAVPDLRETLVDAYELVEEGFLKEEDFRRLTFSNPVDYLAGSKPDFFAGTAVEDAVGSELERLGLGIRAN